MKVIVKLSLAVLMLALLVGCVSSPKATNPDDFTPDQKAVYEQLIAFQNAWNGKDMAGMEAVYTSDSPELKWLRENSRDMKGNITVRADEIAVFGEDAFAKIYIGGWKSRQLASFVKQDGQWKMEFRSKGR